VRYERRAFPSLAKKPSGLRSLRIKRKSPFRLGRAALCGLRKPGPRANPAGEIERRKMTAGELKATLAEYPDDMPVVLSRDSEGNEHRPLADVSGGLYEPENDCCGNVLAEEDESIASDKAVVLWPIN